VAAVDGVGLRQLQRLTRGVLGALRDGVIARAELELDDIADGRRDGVWDEGVLCAADDDCDELVGPALDGEISSDCLMVSNAKRFSCQDV
jgi:hypothetical protein